MHNNILIFNIVLTAITTYQQNYIIFEAYQYRIHDSNVYDYIIIQGVLDI